MKIFDVKKKFLAVASAVLSACMLLGVFAMLSPLSVIDAGAAEENIYEASKGYVVFEASDMEGRLSGESQVKIGFGNVDGVNCLRLKSQPRNSGGYDPYVSFLPEGTYSADDYKYIALVVKSSIAVNSRFSIYYSVNGAHMSGETVVGTQYAVTDDWQVLVFDFSQKNNWTGTISAIRYDFFEGNEEQTLGQSVSIAAAIFCKTPDDVYESSYSYLADNIYGSVQTLSDFTNEELQYFCMAEGEAVAGSPWLGSLDTVTGISTDDNLLLTYKYDESVEHDGPDPYVSFFYDKFAEARGIEALSTEDFGYVMLRYRTGGSEVGASRLQLYQYTGSDHWPTNQGGSWMAPSTAYPLSTANQWKAVVVDMAGGAGAEDWNGAFNGFRIDWATPSSKTATLQMEISDIIFFNDKEQAYSFGAALNTINLSIPEAAVYEDYDNPITLSDDCFMLLPKQLEKLFKGSSDSTVYTATNKGVNVLRLETTAETSDPTVYFKPKNVSADEYKFVTLMIKSEVWTGPALRLDYTTSNMAAGVSDHYVVRYAADKDWQLITIPLDGRSSWSGTVKEMALHYLSYDPVFTGYGKGVTLDIAGIAFSKTADAFYDSAYYLMTETFRPVQVLTNFAASELPCFSSSGGLRQDTVVSQQNGNVVLKGSDNLRDPFVGFYYHDLMDIRGVDAADRISTADFRATVVRYRTSPTMMAPNMQFFLFTGEHRSPFQLNGGFVYTASGYSATPYNTWRSLCIDMKGNDRATEAWQGSFNGFRIDWCSGVAPEEYMEISEFFFFDNVATAEKFTQMVNSLYQPTFGEFNDDYVVPIKAPEDCLIVGPEALDKNMKDSANSTHYLVNSFNVPAVRVEVSEATDHPVISYYPENVSADDYKYVTMMVRSSKTYGSSYSLNYSTDKSKNIDIQYASGSYSTTTDWQFITFNMSGKDSWQGMIDELRLLYVYNGYDVLEGVTYDIVGVAFCKSEDAVFDAAYYMTAAVYKPMQALSDFAEEDVNYFGGSDISGNTHLSFANGNVKYTAELPENNANATVAADPQKLFNYLSYVNKKGIKPLTTDVFQYTVVRYRSEGVESKDAQMELFILTGDAESLTDMVREGEAACHSGIANYSNTSEWRTAVVNMAEDDGLYSNTKLKYGWNREDGNTTFKGFRFDWCMKSTPGANVEVSDFIFFANADEAQYFSSVINTVHVPGATGDNTDPGFGDDWPNEDESTSEEESVPEFSNPEDTDWIEPEDSTESDVDTDSEDESEETTETDDESEDSDTDSEETDDETEIGNKPIIPGTEADTEQSGGTGGSQAPFYIVCTGLALLTVASLVSVLVIRIKCKGSEIDS